MTRRATFTGPYREAGTLSFDEFKAAQQFLGNIQASFQYFDVTRTGKLTKAEVLQAGLAKWFLGAR
jgi:hypothetical protein